MIILLKRIIYIVLCVLYLLPIEVYASELTVSAQSAVCVDCYSDTVLYSKNPTKARPMASTTKIMTCLLACESNKLTDVVEISETMLEGVEGTLIYLDVGDKITLIDLVKGAMLSSGNDAANAIAVYLADNLNSFVDMMNCRAEEIGMENTLFVTPSGLDKGNHHSTAYDMAILTKTALSNSIFMSVCSSQSDIITINGEKQTIYNHNKLLNDENFVGVKTGYTEKSGRCLVSAYKYENNIIIVVTLSASDDWQDHKKIIEYSKKQYKQTKQHLQFDIALVGNAENLYCNCCADFAVVSVNNVNIKAYYYPFLYDNIVNGDVVGYVEIYNEKTKIMTVDIIVKE